MKQVFAATNTVEAYMIQNMLLQSNIHSHLQSEHLQSAASETQADPIKVIVEDSDYLKAISIVREWEDKQPKSQSKESTKKKGKGILLLLIGMIAGALMSTYFNRTPVNETGIDYNQDSKNDVQNIYNGNRLTSSTVDRNFDGAVDLKHTYSYQGIIKSSEADEDFNGTFETLITYQNGNITLKQSDSTGDGFYDIQIKYKHGIKYQTMFIDPTTKLPLKIHEFNTFKLTRSQTILKNSKPLIHTYNQLEQINEN